MSGIAQRSVKRPSDHAQEEEKGDEESSKRPKLEESPEPQDPGKKV